MTLVFALPAAGKGLRWLTDPRRSTLVESGREYLEATRFQAGANGRLSRYPLGAVADRDRGLALGIDPTCPAQYRIGYSEGSGELYLAYDLGLVPEKRRARLRFCRFDLTPGDGFRGALARYYALFPDAFRCRTPAAGPVDAVCQDQPGAGAGRISVSSSRRATTRRRGTTSTASSRSATRSR